MRKSIKKIFSIGMSLVMSFGILSNIPPVYAAEELSVWVMGDSSEATDEIFAKFTEETGINVNVQSIPWSASHDRLLTAVASGDGPDVIQMGTTFMKEFVEAGALEDLTEYVTKNEGLKPELFFEGNIATNKFDDKYYGVPWYTETRALYYRKDLLKEAGYPEGPSTWEELYDAAVKLKKRGDGFYGFNIEMNEQTFGFMFARQNGSKLISEDGKALLNEPEYVEAIQYLHKFAAEGLTPTADLGLDVSQTFGGDAIVPMFISGPWMISIINNSTEGIEDLWTVRTLPKGKVSNQSNTGGANLAVWKGTENVENAVKLIEYMVSEDSLMDYYEKSSSLPALKSAWNSESLSEEKIAAFGEQLNNSEHMPLLSNWDAISQAYLSAYEQIMIGNADIQQTLDSLNEEVQNLLD
ncbi:sugar ABC transporter substrate-binding protein [Aerococcaceae bacterium zg-BR22]|uniref:sugar ABC transporter substrate-binding protein n=1 Tax=Aerococcaceae bacterium zg-1292 TaxID=2774330 RepID=UPI004062E122|nr:sugar ABC transporter substrate-binding protein [Aerococcaceae bacterium zg-BR22]